MLAHRRDDLLAVRIHGQRLAHLSQSHLLPFLGLGRRVDLAGLGPTDQLSGEHLLGEEFNLVLEGREQLRVSRVDALADLAAPRSVGRRAARLARHALDLRRIPRLKLIELLGRLLLVACEEPLEALGLVHLPFGIKGRRHHIPVRVLAQVDTLLRKLVDRLLVLTLAFLALGQLVLRVAKKELLVAHVIARRLEYLRLALLQVLAPRDLSRLGERRRLFLGSPRCKQCLRLRLTRRERRTGRAASHVLRAFEVLLAQPLGERIALAPIGVARRLVVHLGHARDAAAAAATASFRTRASATSAAPLDAAALALIALALFLGALPLALLFLQRTLHRRSDLVLAVVVLAVAHHRVLSVLLHDADGLLALCTCGSLGRGGR